MHGPHLRSGRYGMEVETEINFGHFLGNQIRAVLSWRA